jgi:transporter family protein
MNTQLFALFLGGILPAILFGFSGFSMKYSMIHGMGVGSYLLVFSMAELGTSALFFILFPPGDRIMSMSGVTYSLLAGAARTLGAGLVVYAVVRYAAPISKLTPLYNTNTLITVLLGLIILAEWRNVNSPKLLIGTVLIVVGSVLVAEA